MQKEKKSNFELLRIISMLMIIGLHYFNGSIGGAIDNIPKGHSNYYATIILETIFIPSVNIFILISGYFMSSKENIQLIKPIRIARDATLFGVLVYFISVLVKHNEFYIFDFIKSAFPFFFGLRWFAEVYIIYYILSPFINRALNTLAKKELKSLIIVWILFFSIWSSFLPSPPVTDMGYGIIHFITMHIIAYYIRNHMGSFKQKTKCYYLLVYLLSTVSAIIFAFTFEYFNFGNRAWGYDFIFNIISSLSVFMLFRQFNFTSKIINNIATCAFTVYLTHSNPAFNDVIYGQILKTQNYWMSKYFVLHLLISCIFLYFIGVVFEYARRTLLGSMEVKLEKMLKRFIPLLFKEFPEEV